MRTSTSGGAARVTGAKFRMLRTPAAASRSQTDWATSAGVVMTPIEASVAATQASIGVITTPAEVAQSVCDRLAAAGVRSILNFAPVTLAAPAGVDVRKVDLSVELQVLAFLGQQRLVRDVVEEPA